MTNETLIHPESLSDDQLDELVRFLIDEFGVDTMTKSESTETNTKIKPASTVACPTTTDGRWVPVLLVSQHEFTLVVGTPQPIGVVGG